MCWIQFPNNKKQKIKIKTLAATLIIIKLKNNNNNNNSKKIINNSFNKKIF